MLQKNPDKRLNSVLPGPWLRLPNSVTSPLFSNFYIGLKLKSTNALNINVFLLPTKKLLSLLNYLSTQPDLCSAPSNSCYSLCCHPLYMFFSKNRQSLISLCITSSLELTSCLIPPALYKTPSCWCHTYKFTSHLLTTLPLHHTFTVSFQAQNSPFPQIVSTVVC